MIRENIKALTPYLSEMQKQALQELDQADYILAGETLDRYHLHFDGQPLTPTAEADYTQKKVRKFLESPRIFQFNSTAASYYHEAAAHPSFELEEFSFEFNKKVYKKFQHKIGQKLSSDGEEKVLIICNLHLGLQVLPLCEALNITHVLILEQSLDLLYYSMLVNDWSKVTDFIESQYGTLTFLIHPNLELLSKSFGDLLSARYHINIDGSYIYTHGTHPIERKMNEVLLKQISSSFTYNGWLEDDNLIYLNIVDNSALSTDILLDKKAPAQHDKLAVIAANGPSLDADLDWIKENRDRIILFSSGTTLQALLKNDIRPDFQVELENGLQVPEISARMAEEYGLDGIILLASLGVDYRSRQYFEDTWFYLRGGNSAFIWYRGSSQHLLGHATISCTNAAVACAYQLGYRHLAFVGMDFGTNDLQYHHSKSSVYYSRDQKDGYLNKIFDRNNRKFPHVKKGNFRDIIHTNEIMSMMCSLVENQIADAQDATFYNCSDGSYIIGADPLRSRDIPMMQFSPNNQENANQEKSLLKNFYQEQENAYLSLEKIQQLSQSFNRIFDHILTIIADEKRTFQKQLFDIYYYIVQREGYQKDFGVYVSLIGSFQRILMFLHYINLRGVDHPDDLREIRHMFFQQITQIKREQTAFCQCLYEIFDGHFNGERAFSQLYMMDKALLAPILLKYETEQKDAALREGLLQIFTKAGERLERQNYLWVTFYEILSRHQDQVAIFQEMEACLNQWLGGAEKPFVIDYPKSGHDSIFPTADQAVQQRRSALYGLALMNHYELNLEMARQYPTSQEQDFLLALYEIWYLKDVTAASAYLAKYDTISTENVSWQAPLWAYTLKGAIANDEENYAQAAELLETAAADMPRLNVFFLVELVYSFYFQGDMEKVEKYSSKIFTENPQQVDAHFLLRKGALGKEVSPKSHAIKRVTDRIQFQSNASE